MSVYYDCIAAVKTTIDGLTLTGIAANSRVQRKLPTDRGTGTTANVTLPMVITSMSPTPELVNPDGTQLNEQDDWGYPVLVTTVSETIDVVTLDDTDLTWRQTIKKAFNWKRPSGFPSTLKYTRVEPGVPIDMGLFVNSKLHVATLIVRCICREGRS